MKQVYNHSTNETLTYFLNRQAGITAMKMSTFQSQRRGLITRAASQFGVFIVLLVCFIGLGALTLKGQGIIATNVCPATTVDLSNHVTASPPVGTVLEWHNALPVSAANLMNATQVANAGAGTYYAVYRDTLNNCYGPVSDPVTVILSSCVPIQVTNICPLLTVDLTAHVTAFPPTGTVLEWHNAYRCLLPT